MIRHRELKLAQHGADEGLGFEEALALGQRDVRQPNQLLKDSSRNRVFVNGLENASAMRETRRIVRDVGVEQECRRISDIETPDACDCVVDVAVGKLPALQRPDLRSRPLQHRSHAEASDESLLKPLALQSVNDVATVDDASDSLSQAQQHRARQRKGRLRGGVHKRCRFGRNGLAQHPACHLFRVSDSSRGQRDVDRG
ncbi:hypothetical protein D9M73_96690 [compost metagenome]